MPYFLSTLTIVLFPYNPSNLFAGMFEEVFFIFFFFVCLFFSPLPKAFKKFYFSLLFISILLE